MSNEDSSVPCGEDPAQTEADKQLEAKSGPHRTQEREMVESSSIWEEWVHRETLRELEAAWDAQRRLARAYIHKIQNRKEHQ